MRLVRILRWLTIGASAVLLLLLGSAVQWLAAGFLESMRDYVALAATAVQAIVLLCVIILAACRAEGRWGWITFMLIETLATGVSAVFGLNWSNPGPELPMALLPLLCTAVMAALNALLYRMERNEHHA